MNPATQTARIDLDVLLDLDERITNMTGIRTTSFEPATAMSDKRGDTDMNAITPHNNQINDTRFNDFIERTKALGSIAGQGEDVQIKHLLDVTQMAFDGVIDNTENKHGTGVDDAALIAENYWNSRNHQVIFNPKAGNQRKTMSCVRQCITLGGWSKGGSGEPIGMINRAMTNYRNLRKVPGNSKRMVDPANYLITIARKMKRSDTLLDDEELQELTFKPDHEQATVEDVLDGMRRTAAKLISGKHPAGMCGGANLENVVKALNRELKAIADGRRGNTEAKAAADIAAEADRQTKADGAASVSA